MNAITEHTPHTLALWSALEKTDPKYTKPFSRGGGFKGTATNGTYIAKKLTEAFGPCGRGWKFVIEDERIEEGHTLKGGDRTKVHIIRGHISYMIDGVWYDTSPQFGQTMFVDQNKYGVFTDEEAPKKSITDCISKCAVMLGVAADIHLGMFDDNKYVNERRAEEAQKNGNGKPAPKRQPTPDIEEIERQREEMDAEYRAATAPEVMSNEPHMIQLPAGPEKDAWTRWTNRFLLAVSTAETVADVDQWVLANDDHITGLQGFNDKWHSALKAKVKAHRDSIAGKEP